MEKTNEKLWPKTSYFSSVQHKNGPIVNWQWNGAVSHRKVLERGNVQTIMSLLLLWFIFVLILRTWSLVFHLLWNEIVGVINAGEVFGESFGNPREGETSFPREREGLGAAREREARNKSLATGITVNIVGFKSDWTDKDCLSSNVFLLNLKQTCLILDTP